ncbi:PAPA-1-like conserved region-domain-containing protein [Phascolomyces articulosus]|uniref:PAPA-1-like conserved region-domain-containing protein n=1 Tax=Phascolomyces articulosus TaxID=60185 RepID=A0AAD5PJM2_9FUNG|nr:PAPA-1-like conserved region-domain-containing protein [Phascolomyces articulosus]
MKSRKISPTPSDDELSDEELDLDDEGVDDLGEEEIDEEDMEEDDLQEEEDEEEDDDDDDDESTSVTESETPDVTPRSSRKNQKRKKAAYEEPDSDEDEEDYEVVSNRPLTKRQRAKLENNGSEEFLELPMESMKKKHLTEEEQTLKRSEVARRRKNQSIERAEKDKQDTINRLLKKQASKSRRIIKDDGTDEKESGTSTRRVALVKDPNALQYVSTPKGNFLSIPTSINIEQVFGPSFD